MIVDLKFGFYVEAIYIGKVLKFENLPRNTEDSMDSYSVPGALLVLKYLHSPICTIS